MTTYRVSSQEEFDEIINGIEAGDILYLKPGKYLWNPEKPIFNPAFTLQASGGDKSNTTVMITPNVKNIFNGMSYIGLSIEQIPLSKEYYVHNSEELFEALKRVSLIDRIVLAPGTYEWGQTRPVKLPSFLLVGETGDPKDVTFWVTNYAMEALLTGPKISGMNIAVSFN